MPTNSKNPNSTTERDCQNDNEQTENSMVVCNAGSDKMDVDNEESSSRNDTERENAHGGEFGTENCSASASSAVVDGSNHIVSRPTMPTGNALLRSYFEQIYDTTPSSDESPTANKRFCHHNVHAENGEGPSASSNSQPMIQNVYPIDAMANSGQNGEMNPIHEFGQAGEQSVPMVQNQIPQNNNVDGIVPPGFAYIEVQDANRQIHREEFIQIQDGDRIIYGGIVGREEQLRQLQQRQQEISQQAHRLLQEIRHYQYLRYFRRDPNEARLQFEVLNFFFPTQQQRVAPVIQPFPPGAAPGYILVNGGQVLNQQIGLNGQIPNQNPQIEALNGGINRHIVEIEVRRRCRVAYPQQENEVRQQDFDEDEIPQLIPPGDNTPDPDRHLHQYADPPGPRFCIMCGHVRPQDASGRARPQCAPGEARQQVAHGYPRPQGAHHALPQRALVRAQPQRAPDDAQPQVAPDQARRRRPCCHRQRRVFGSVQPRQ